MKLVLFNDYQLGVLTDSGIVDASAAVEGLNFHNPQRMMEILIEGWDDLKGRIEDSVAGKDGVALDSVKLRPPMPRPGQLVCLAGNYMEPAQPDKGTFNAFLKSSTGVIGSGDTVELPEADVSWFHFEPELALVISKTACKVTQDEAMDCVFGYTQFIDASARGLPGGFFLGKSWHTFGPMGPALVTADEVPEPNNLSMRMWVNDELRHDVKTSDMARRIPELLEVVTNVLTLEPGNVVSTGTHHFGLLPIQDGEVVRHEIEGFGSPLTVDVYDPLKRTEWIAKG